MLLKEFFGKTLNSTSPVEKESKRKVDHDDLFWYIIDHDKLHKDHFFPIAKKVKELDECTPEMVLELYMPMVKKGCKEYYAERKLKGKLGKIFDKELLEDLCHKLHDHYFEDVKKDRYNLG
jgi:hypothetical protein